MLIIVLLIALLPVLTHGQSPYEKKVAEYDALYNANLELEADTLALFNDLSKLMSSNRILEQSLNQSEAKVESLEENKINLLERKGILNDSLSNISLLNEDLKKLIKKDSLNQLKQDSLNLEIEKLRLDTLNLINNRELLITQRENLESEIDHLKELKSETAIFRAEFLTLSQEIKNLDKQIIRTNSDLTRASNKVLQLKQDRQVYTFFNDVKLQNIKNRKEDILSQLSCDKNNKKIIEDYLTEIDQLITSGIDDSEINSIKYTITNQELTCSLVEESKKALEVEYKKENIDKLLIQINSTQSTLNNLLSLRQALNEYCSKTKLALAYIDRASTHDQTRMERYLDVILQSQEFDDYPFLKEELIRFRDTNEHSISQVNCN